MLETNMETQFLIHVREKCKKVRKFEEQLTHQRGYDCVT